MTSVILSRRCELYQTNRWFRVRTGKFSGALVYLTLFRHIDTPIIRIESAQLMDKKPPTLI